MTRPALTEISEAGQLLVWGMRHWMVANLQRARVPASVGRVFELLGGPALSELAALVLLAARDADRPLVIHPPCSLEVSADEDGLARALAAAGDSSEARRCLRGVLGGDTSAALLRCLAALAERFKSSGLTVAEPAPRAAGHTPDASR